MHIKSVAIQGFLSYDKLDMGQNLQLSPGCNLILGKNGSGKSNFLQGKSSNCTSLMAASNLLLIF